MNNSVPIEIYVVDSLGESSVYQANSFEVKIPGRWIHVFPGYMSFFVCFESDGFLKIETVKETVENLECPSGTISFFHDKAYIFLD